MADRSAKHGLTRLAEERSQNGAGSLFVRVFVSIQLTFVLLLLQMHRREEVSGAP